ncbi:MOSC domain-containing protein [Deinococcus puniceus]|uniref:Molybdenum cofactor biosysynthesis protein n=1 Tax=Deinococcus puniceus TaxID=1182568 RepID=A0A172T9R4_9DEIO|nr:MOSC domain-containing protein [Deinococcus puniceus]ANE43676.1 molybdenum cofactor biosysynthesis protein [Deinococcus puniceus]
MTTSAFAPAHIVSVAASPTHGFSKQPVPSVHLLAGVGVQDDAHAGHTVKHRSRVAADPTQPNLRQVHLIHAELLDELNAAGFGLQPGDLGENVLTRGVDLLALPIGTRLHLGAEAVIKVTGLRNPCSQIENFRPGLLAAVLGRDEDGNLIRKAGIMGVVAVGGEIRQGDSVQIELPPLPHRALERV